MIKPDKKIRYTRVGPSNDGGVYSYPYSSNIYVAYQDKYTEYGFLYSIDVRVLW